MDYQMIVLDLDGTLTNRDKEVTERTRQVLLESRVSHLMVRKPENLADYVTFSNDEDGVAHVVEKFLL